MTFAWIAIGIAGLLTAAYGSRRAVGHAVTLARGLNLQPYLVGFALLAIGTDVPEILHAVIASASGHGDLALGDTTGSVATQITLGLAVLALVGGTYPIGRRRVIPVNVLTMAGLALVAILSRDGWLSRTDALVLIGAWAIATTLVWRVGRPLSEALMERSAGQPLREALLALGFLGLVGAGAAAVVRSVVELAPLVGIPEYLISFFATALGTSMPEIVVDIHAIRAGRRDLALGDVLGSCLVDSTLAPGLGPLLFPVGVTVGLATRGALVAIAATAGATLFVAGFRRLDRKMAVALLAGYLMLFLGFLPA
jgi:cation:H+ antiporter